VKAKQKELLTHVKLDSKFAEQRHRSMDAVPKGIHGAAAQNIIKLKQTIYLIL
jgi:hypothetical protein